MSDLLVVALDGDVEEVWRECADVLYGTRPLPLTAALRLSALVLRRYPGAVLVLVPRPDGGLHAFVRRSPPQSAMSGAPRAGLSQGRAYDSPAGPCPCR